MKVYLFSVLLLVSSWLQAQDLPTPPNAYDAEGLKTGNWIYFFDKDWSKLDQKDSVAYYRLMSYQNGQPTGKMVNYYKSGQIQMEGFLISEEPEKYDGEVKYYDEEGYMINYAFFNEGIKDNVKTEKGLEKLVEKLQKEIPNHPSYVKALKNFADLYAETGRFQLAAPLYLKVININKELLGESNAEYADDLFTLAELYHAMGLFKASEPLYVNALEIYKMKLGENHSSYILTLNFLADLYRYMGRYQIAEPMFLKSLALYKTQELKDDFYYSYYINNLAVLYHQMGRYTEAEKLYLETVEINKEQFGIDHPDYAISLANLAVCYSDMGLFNKAEPLVLEALEIEREQLGENHPSYAYTLGNMADIYIEMERYMEAKPLAKQSLEIRKTQLGKDNSYYASSLSLMADLNLALGNNSLPEKQYKEALSIRKTIFSLNSKEVMSSKRSLASYYYFTKQAEKADALFLEVIDFYLSYIREYFEYLGETERQAFYSTTEEKLAIFTDYALLRHDENPSLLSKLYEVRLYTKALLINTSNQIKKRIIESGDRKLIDLFDEVQQLRQQLGKAQLLTLAEQEEQGISQDSLKQVLQEKDNQLNELSQFYTTEAEAITWQSIQGQLEKNEAAVEVIRFRPFDHQRNKFKDEVRYAALIITLKTKDHPELVIFSDGNFLEEKAIKRYKKSIEFELNDKDSYDAFWAPLKEKLRKIDKVYFSPDGIFHQINMGTLYNPDKDRYLFEELDLKVITSSRDLLAQEREPLKSQYALLLGNPAFGKMSEQQIANDFETAVATRGSLISPLPGTKEEIIQIGNLLKSKGWRQQMLLAEDAREEALKDMLKPKILHIATHGYFQANVEGGVTYANNPLFRSGVLLTGAANNLVEGFQLRGNVEKGKEDGVLTAYEAMNLNIDNTDLVVLSACETGLGEVKNGEGVYGLQRAFKVAGARSILMSLWKVNDETTQELMVSFYQHWIVDGLSKREAFKKAQKQLKAKYPHPYYWGAFVLIGE